MRARLTAGTMTEPRDSASEYDGSDGRGRRSSVTDARAADIESLSPSIVAYV